MNLPPDFKELLEEFARDGVEYVVIGGYAFAFHVERRATKDLDLLLEGSEENRERATRALARYGAPPNVVDATRTLAETEVAYLGLASARIDLLRAMSLVVLQRSVKYGGAAAEAGACQRDRGVLIGKLECGTCVSASMAAPI